MHHETQSKIPYDMIPQPKSPCKRTHHCCPKPPNIVGCYMLRPFANPVACWLRVVRGLAYGLKLVKVLAMGKQTQQLPPLLGQQYWALLNTFEPGISPKLSSDIVDVMKIETRENNKRVLAPKAFLTLLYSIRYFPIYLNFEPEIG